jgi:hypothetical protein
VSLSVVSHRSSHAVDAVALTADRRATTTSPATTVASAVTSTAAVRQTSPSTTVTTTTTSTTTTTTPPAPPPPIILQDGQTGKASWYPEAPTGYCASPYLTFGTVVTITDEATGRSIRCTVDDRQARNPGRVIDLSYDGFADLADPSIGLVEVYLTW